MHLERADYAQVPWFQCVMHVCKYYFKEKFDYNYWLVRATLANRMPKLMR